MPVSPIIWKNIDLDSLTSFFCHSRCSNHRLNTLLSDTICKQQMWPIVSKSSAHAQQISKSICAKWFNTASVRFVTMTKFEYLLIRRPEYASMYVCMPSSILRNGREHWFSPDSHFLAWYRLSVIS